jgi:hypothetical protein
MTHATTHPAEASRTSSHPKRALTGLRLLAFAVPIAIVVIGAVMLPGWVPELPRVVQCGMTEAVLRGVLIVYSALLLMAFVGLPLSGWLFIRSRRVRRRRPEFERGFLIAVSCLLSLVMLELAADSPPSSRRSATRGSTRSLGLGRSSRRTSPHWALPSAASPTRSSARIGSTATSEWPGIATTRSSGSGSHVAMPRQPVESARGNPRGPAAPRGRYRSSVAGCFGLMGYLTGRNARWRG